MAKNKVIIIGLIIVSLFAAVVGSGVADGSDPYADEVVSFTQGYVWDTTKAEPPGTWGYTDAPEVALGGPTEGAGSGNAYFVSLGSRPAGEIILKFVDYVLIDGDDNSGYDLAIYEFGAADDAHVYLSNDSSGDGQPDGWIYLGYTRDDATLSRQTGSHPDYITGDSSSSLFLFDVAGKLDSIGGWASFIRIVDDDIGRKDPNFTDGFDLNAVELLNYTTLDELNNPEEEEPADDETPDEGDNPGGDEEQDTNNCCYNWCSSCWQAFSWQASSQDGNSWSNNCNYCDKSQYSNTCYNKSNNSDDNKDCDDKKSSGCGATSDGSGKCTCQTTEAPKTSWWKYGFGRAFSWFSKCKGW